VTANQSGSNYSIYGGWATGTGGCST
jgi:hypothetical protein